MINLLIGSLFLALNFAMTIYLARRGFKGLREKKMVCDRAGNFATGKDAAITVTVRNDQFELQSR